MSFSCYRYIYISYIYIYVCGWSWGGLGQPSIAAAAGAFVAGNAQVGLADGEHIKQNLPSGSALSVVESWETPGVAAATTALDTPPTAEHILPDRQPDSEVPDPPQEIELPTPKYLGDDFDAQKSSPVQPAVDTQVPQEGTPKEMQECINGMLKAFHEAKPHLEQLKKFDDAGEILIKDGKIDDGDHELFNQFIASLKVASVKGVTKPAPAEDGEPPAPLSTGAERGDGSKEKVKPRPVVADKHYYSLLVQIYFDGKYINQLLRTHVDLEFFRYTILAPVLQVTQVLLFPRQELASEGLAGCAWTIQLERRARLVFFRVYRCGIL